MYKPIEVFVNGVYQFTTKAYRTCLELKNYLRAVKHIEIASIPTRYLTVYDYDKITCRYAKEA